MITCSKQHFPNGERHAHSIFVLLQVNEELYRPTKAGKPQGSHAHLT